MIAGRSARHWCAVGRSGTSLFGWDGLSDPVSVHCPSHVRARDWFGRPAAWMGWLQRERMGLMNGLSWWVGGLGRV